MVASMIRLGFCFDLLDPDNARDLKSFHDDVVQARAATGLAPLENQRRHKYLDYILGSWLLDPIGEAEDGEEEHIETHPAGDQNPEGGESLPLDDDPGAPPAYD